MPRVMSNGGVKGVSMAVDHIRRNGVESEQVASSTMT